MRMRTQKVLGLMQYEASSKSTSTTTRSLVLGASIAGALLLSGCGAGRELKGGMTAYEHGNFNRAQQRCEKLDESELDDKAAVRYLAYCGLAYYKTGHSDLAKTFLQNGQKLYQSGDPEWLKPIIVDEMNKAVDNLNTITVTVPIVSVSATDAAPAVRQDDTYE